MGDAVDAGTEAADTLLLGRRTHEVFAASWPQRTVEDDPMAGWMNDTPKVVVSSTLESPAWQNTTVIDGDTHPHHHRGQIPSMSLRFGSRLPVSGQLAVQP